MILLASIGEWYCDEDKNQTFEVVAIDEKEDTIEIQYNDGNIGEFDRETWRQTALSAAAAPEDANAAYEQGTEEDWHSDVSAVGTSASPLDLIEAEHFDYDVY